MMPEYKETLIASELLASVSILEIFPTLQQKVEFADRAIKTVIGISDCGFCMKGYTPSSPINAACQGCGVKNEVRIDKAFDCPLQNNANHRLIPLSTTESFFGYFLVSEESIKQIFLYEHLLLNFLTILSISLDNLQKGNDLEKLNLSLRKSEARYKSLSSEFEAILDHIPGLVFYKDKKNNFIRVNKYVAQSYGKEKKELEGKCLSDLHQKEDAEKYYQDDLSVINSGIAKLNIEEPWETEDGVKWVSTSKIPFVDDAGEIIGVIGMSIDITERKRAEEELSREQYLMQMLMDNLPDHIYFKDLESRFIRINKSHALKFRLDDPDCAIGKTDFDFFSEEHSQQAYEDEQTIIRTGQLLSLEEKETYHDRPDTWVSTIKMPLFDREGKIIGTFGISKDITEHKREEEEIKLKNKELQKLNAEKDKFFSIIAHDLKNPFNSIIGFSDLLVEQAREKKLEGIEEYAGFIRQSSHRAMGLLMNLMEWAQSQTGRMEFNPEFFNLADTVHETALLFSDGAGQKSIIIKEELPANVPVYADKAMTSTILRNLISNAIKFTMPGGEIIISTEENQGGLTVSVSDTGLGIPKDALDKLFRLDKSYSTSGTQNEQGTGLGLILCKDFIEKHGGKIWVESEEGIGSRFYFTIPHKTEPEEKMVIENPAPGNINESQIRKLKILIAEDDRPSEMLLKIVAKMFAKEVIVARTGLETVEVCRNHPDIDLILMDIQMPGMDGYEATRQIRKFNNKVIIIAQTAYAIAGDREKSLVAGCNDYISKPIKKEKLMELIEKYFKNH